jgi:hypothetical protein
MHRLVVLIDSGLLKYSTRFVARKRLGIPNDAPTEMLANHPSAMATIYDVLATSMRYKLGGIETNYGKIDRCVVCLDIGDSWRCNIPKTPIPDTNAPSSIAYKGHRRTDDPVELEAITKLNGVYKQCINYICRNSGIEQVGSYAIESDDFMVTLSKIYADQGDYVFIMSTDADITQAVYTSDAEGFVAVMQPKENSTMQLVVDVATKDLSRSKDIFHMTQMPLGLANALNAAVVVDPSVVVLNKILNGDGSDDISPVMVREVNGRHYKLNTKQFIAVLETLNSPEHKFTTDDLYLPETIRKILSMQHQFVHKAHFDTLPEKWQNFYIAKFIENRQMVLINKAELGEHYNEVINAAMQQLHGTTPVIAFPTWDILQKLDM